MALTRNVQQTLVERVQRDPAFARALLDEAAALPEFKDIIDQLAEFYEPGAALQWILAPQELLGGERPLELIRTGRIGEVLQLVGRLRDSVYL